MFQEERNLYTSTHKIIEPDTPVLFCILCVLIFLSLWLEGYSITKENNKKLPHLVSQLFHLQ